MALSDLDPTGGVGAQYGIRLQVTTPSGYRPVLERSTVGSGGPFTELVELPVSDGTAQVWVDVLPFDSATRWYRAKSRRTGENDSGVTAVVSGVPVRQ